MAALVVRDLPEICRQTLNDGITSRCQPETSALLAGSLEHLVRVHSCRPHPVPLLDQANESVEAGQSGVGTP